MSTGNPAAEALKPIAEAAAPGWGLQFGRWVEGTDPTKRFVVMRPIGGPAAQLVRQPALSVMFIGAIGDADAVASLVAEQFTAALRAGPISGVAYAEATEPNAYPTSDGRPVSEVVVSSIVSL